MNEEMKEGRKEGRKEGMTLGMTDYLRENSRGKITFTLLESESNIN